jgi:hypothetical protein
MKHEHVMCRANDIKQKCLLGGNPTQKNIRFALFFSLIFYFRILFYFYHSLIFIFFYFNIEDNFVFKVWGYKEDFLFLFRLKKRKRKKKCLLSFELPLVYNHMSIMYEN